jgi:hypothetical protein
MRSEEGTAMSMEERKLLRAYKREGLHDAAVAYGMALLAGESTDELESKFWHAYELMIAKGDESEDRGFTVLNEHFADCAYARDELEALSRYLWPLPYAIKEDVLEPIRRKIAGLAAMARGAAIVGLG